MNFYQHHIGDYAAATAHLSWDEDCAYRRLLSYYYQTEKPLPSDLAMLCRVVRATNPKQRRAVATILPEFFELRDGCWHQRRCDEEIEQMHRKRESAKASADARWRSYRGDPPPPPEGLNGHANAMRTHRENDANAMRTHSEGNAPRSHKPVTSNQEQHRSSRCYGDDIAHERAREAGSPGTLQQQTPMPANFPNELDAAWCRRTRPDLDVRLMVEKFRNLYAPPGETPLNRSNWPQTWRSFVLREYPPRSGDRRAGVQDRRRAAFDALTGQNRGQDRRTEEWRDDWPEVVDIEAREVGNDAARCLG